MRLLAILLAVAAGAVDETSFRWERTLRAPAAASVSFVPDGLLYGHAAPGFVDLRILDADGRQVPWRLLELRGDERLEAARVLNSGTQGGAAVALLDFGPRRVVRDRIQLDVPLRPFVGRAEVFGSSDGRSFTRLSATSIYDVRGATRAVSAAVVFPPSDFRYYRIRATGVAAIRGATATGSPAAERLVARRAEVEIRADGRATVVEAALPYRNIWVHELRFLTTTPAFDRPLRVEGSMDRESWFPAGGGRLYRFGGERLTSVPLSSRYRYLRIRIENGDDEPLRELRVRLLAYRQLIVLAPRHAPPYRILYGGRADPPEYDFAQLPEPRVRPAVVALGPERRNPSFELPPDTRSFAERHPAAIQATLALAAAALVAAGFLALRRRT